MGEALFELEQVLRSKQDKLTPQEANLLLSCKSKAARDFTASALVGGAVSWTASWRLSKLFRANLAGGAAAFFGLWRFGRSLDSCVDHILALDGSRLQKELANIIVTKHHNDPGRMQLIDKHFYSEKIYDDSTSDHPKIRWRYRNFFSDNVSHGGKTHDNDSYNSTDGDSQNESYSDATSNHVPSDSDSKKTSFETKHASINPRVDVMADPLDCLFGYTAPVEVIRHSSVSKTPTGMHNHGHRRSHRRRRMRHEHNLVNTAHA
ncbi:Mitochondrial intermediate peptidase [Quillaja saponaria]|uniref:Mitochondrial intermediate peptidase n=1 Tax=Quillaja saponaria TaxID=32244 RepID=A0AAD7QEG4_QUISA|nr:Mitochondrial intermediate peptidase [Quillaja saponaria]